MTDNFLDLFIFNGGLPETLCGRGSTLKVTKNLRTKLPKMLRLLKVSALLDAPCGDFNWLAQTDLSRVKYVGADLDEDNLKEARLRYDLTSSLRPRSVSFLHRDLLTDSLPRADAVMCHDFLQHLPHDMVRAVLQNFARSGARWFLATSHGNAKNDDISLPGEFRPLNLTVPPLSLTQPAWSIKDPPDSGRVLGVWPMRAVVKSI